MNINAAIKTGLSKPDLQALTGWLAELLVSQQYAKLSEGGHVQNSIPLKSLFIDLPASNDLSAGDTRFNILEALEASPFVKAKDLSAGQHSLSHSTPGDDQEEIHIFKRITPSKNSPFFSAVLLIGGPGQGKSTVGQLLCQIHRANLLKGLRTLSKLQKDTVDDYSRKREGDIYLGARRSPTLPIQINLPEFAGWLSKNFKEKNDNNIPSALRFLCQTPSAQAHELRPSAILSACREINVQLVLDGFDEVGSQPERLRLVAECRSLILELADCTANIRVLVTTRPQGYTEEFEKIGFKLNKIYLLPLKVEEALVYAHRLIRAKILSADDRNRAQKQIDTAVDEPATKRLFTTPLQITIITALVQQMGNAPRERWNLFAGYFDYAYRREVERQTFASALLRDQRQNIEQMHARVGLILQVRSELEGGASSRMTRPELESIINDILDAEEIPSNKKLQLISDIATAAEDRLVFLTQPEPENYGFEVRSLQEFFSAWALTTGSQTDVENRINRISRASAFKNVYLFAASRIFGSIQSYRDAWINQVCKWHDNPDKDKFSATIKIGSTIALETLEEGVAYNQPKYSKILMALASNILTLPPGNEHIRLAHACTPDNFKQLENSVILGLQSSDRSQRTSAWLVLLECLNINLDWADAIANRHFNIQDWDLIHSASVLGTAHMSNWLASTIEAHLSDIDPEDIGHFRTSSTSSWIGDLVTADLLGRNRNWWHSPVKILDYAPNIPSASTFSYTGNPSWDVLISSANFDISPSADTLSVVCEKLAAVGLEQAKRYIFRSAWPITAIIKTSSSSQNFLELAELVKNGKLGDIDLWREAQDKWDPAPRLQKIIEVTSTELPWDIKKLCISPPLQVFAHYTVHDSLDRMPKAKLANITNNLAAIFNNSPKNVTKSDCANILLAFLTREPKRFRTAIKDVEIWAEYSTSAGYYIFNLLPAIPQEFVVRMASKIRAGSYLGPPDALARAIQTSNGDEQIIRIATESLKIHFNMIDTEYERDNRAEYSAVLELVNNSLGNTSNQHSLIWDIAHRIKTGTFNLLDFNSQEISKLSPNIIAKLLKQRGPINQSETEKYALELIEFNPDLVTNRQIVEAMQEVFARRQSELHLPTVWASIHIDFNHIFTNISDPENSSSKVHAIRSLKIQNVRGIAQLDHTFSDVSKDGGQFVVLIGENGAGKTTILRAIALALRDSSDLSIWPAGAFTSAWRSESQEGTAPGKIVVTFDNSQSIETTITSSGQFRQSASGRDFKKLVFAYGCYRGSAQGSSHGNARLGEDGGPGIATLFDPDARLINAEAWLIQLEARSLKEINRVSSFRSVIKSLCKLLGLSDLKIIGGTLYAETEDKQALPFSALSDGYLSMSGWFIDVVARWVEYLDQTNQNIADDFLSEAQFYILIDEIDAHIHPGWQLDVIHRAKTIFPKCVFIVTTHNPLTLAGASPHEILQLRRLGKVVELIKGAMPPILLTGGQLYKQYFGIEQVIPTEVAKLIATKLTLETKGDLSSADKKELAQTKATLEKIELEGWEHVK